jgi:superfamily I DNA/RNA helicase
MKKAYNQYSKLIDIMESTKKDTYTCPVCKELLTRNFGEKSQFYSHPKGKGEDCELKLKLIIKEDNLDGLSQEQIDILKNEYYNKEFSDVHIELSDYKSNEGYYLTQEQKDIIFAKEDRIKISALAGSAKSSTLYYYGKERPFKKILYLVYNKSMKTEADHMYAKLPNVEVRTIHSLAYGFVGKFYKNKLTFNYGVVDVIKDLNLNWSNDMELATKIHKMMSEYSLSSAIEFEDIDLFDEDERPIIINNCKQLWELKKNYNNNIKITHDDYLKMFQLSKKSLEHKYDIIMLDEAQDSSLLMLDILKSSNVTGIVIVGDPFQSIYGWRNATNIMPYFEGKEYKLTTSFRVSQNIANIANIIVKDINKVDIDMKGFNTNQKIVDKINKNKPYVCLCRTNAYIFAEVFEVVNSNLNAKLFFEGGYSSYNFNNIRDFYFCSKGHKTKNPLFNKFDDFYSMIEYANEIEDVELLALNRMVTKYGSKIPEIVDRIKNNTTTKKSEANVIFSTCHRSKGQTYVIPVYVSDDHFKIEEVFNKEYVFREEFFDINKYYEEMCILYVAITRAANEIELSPKLKSYLLLRWKHFNNTIKNVK